MIVAHHIVRQMFLGIGHLYESAEATMAALEMRSKYSFTTCKLRFFAHFRLALAA